MLCIKTGKIIEDWMIHDLKIKNNEGDTCATLCIKYKHDQSNINIFRWMIHPGNIESVQHLAIDRNKKIGFFKFEYAKRFIMAF